jgi:hypothetical protein
LILDTKTAMICDRGEVLFPVVFFCGNATKGEVSHIFKHLYVGGFCFSRHAYRLRASFL